MDVKESAARNDQIDRAIQAASRDIDGRLHRKFFPLDTTYYFDWPNYQRAYPWRIWLDNKELAAIPTAVVSGGISIPIANMFFEPVNSGPPYTHMEINRATNSSFGLGQTPQRSVAVTGTFGYTTATNPAGALAAAMSDTTSLTLTVTNSAALGIGNVIVIDSERMIVSDWAYTSTGQTQQGSGCSTASTADNALTVTDGTKFFAGELVQLDTEVILITSITGNVLTVRRSWDGSVLATHTGATVYCPRALTVALRGDLGTTAATHLNNAPVSVYHVPSLVRELAIAESINRILQETSGYARTVGEGDNARPASGSGLNFIWQDTIAAYGRQVRKRVI